MKRKLTLHPEPRSKTEPGHQRRRHSLWKKCWPMSRSKSSLVSFVDKAQGFSQMSNFSMKAGQAAMSGNREIEKSCQNMTCPNNTYLIYQMFSWSTDRTGFWTGCTRGKHAGESLSWKYWWFSPEEICSHWCWDSSDNTFPSIFTRPY